MRERNETPGCTLNTAIIEGLVKLIIVILIVDLPRGYRRPTRRTSGKEVLRIFSMPGIRSQPPGFTRFKAGKQKSNPFLPTHGYLCQNKTKTETTERRCREIGIRGETVTTSPTPISLKDSLTHSHTLPLSLLFTPGYVHQGTTSATRAKTCLPALSKGSAWARGCGRCCPPSYPGSCGGRRPT